MNEPDTGFNRGAIRPLRCIMDGWQEIREDYWLFLGITFVGLLIGVVTPLQILMGPMICGIHLCILRRMNGQRVGFEMLFKGFDYFLPSLAIVVTFFLVNLVVTLLLMPFIYLAMGATLFAVMPMGPRAGPPEVLAIVILLGVEFALIFAFTLVLVMIQSLFFFAYPLVVDRQLPGFTALGTSIRAVLGNAGGVSAIVLLWSLVGFFAGLLILPSIGMIFLLPIYYAAMTVAYRQVFPKTRTFIEYFDDELDDADDHDEDRPGSTGGPALLESEDIPSTSIYVQPPGAEMSRPSTDIQAPSAEPPPPADSAE